MDELNSLTIDVIKDIKVSKDAEIENFIENLIIKDKYK